MRGALISIPHQKVKTTNQPISRDFESNLFSKKLVWIKTNSRCVQKWDEVLARFTTVFANKIQRVVYLL